ncbi:hypothetical protein Gohar_015073 [Gossypium harknessii]|uniref:Uncharacterized protein n=1 Tax=Gossypium harknessii TaxID=34285 RepID=A0A7J9FZ43_9ROSI|nr:hypothetical protein [Gossypium harknessii]
MNYFEKIPEFIGSLAELTYLNLSYNPLTGFIPHQLGNLSRLLYLDLNYPHSLRSSNLEWLSHISTLKLLKISHASFEKATNWLQVIQYHPSLSVLHFEYYSLPENLSGCAKDSLESLLLTYNNFNGSLPSFIPFSSLRELDVGYNQLSGHFEDNFGDFSKLSVVEHGLQCSKQP